MPQIVSVLRAIRLGQQDVDLQADDFLLVVAEHRRRRDSAARCAPRDRTARPRTTGGIEYGLECRVPGDAPVLLRLRNSQYVMAPRCLYSGSHASTHRAADRRAAASTTRVRDALARRAWSAVPRSRSCDSSPTGSCSSGPATLRRRPARPQPARQPRPHDIPAHPAQGDSRSSGRDRRRGRRGRSAAKPSSAARSIS